METRKLGPVTAAVDLSALFSDLVRLETELWNLVDQRLRRQHDVPLSWFEPMQVMDRTASCRVVDIAQSLSITVGGASKLVDRIEHAGWCRRAPNPDDARSSVVSLTGAGRRTFKVAQASFVDELASNFGEATSPKSLESLATTLRDLRHHIANQEEPAR